MILGYILLASSILLYLIVMGWLLPHAFLRAEFLTPTLNAFGVRRCIYNGKHCVVYERNANCRRYISRFLLCEGDGCKLLKCKVTNEVKRMRYDVIMFNRYNRVFDVLTVEESPVGNFTQLLVLSDETAYVEIKIRRVNDEVISKTRVAKFKAGKIMLYSISAFLMTVLTGVFVTIGVTYSFGSVFRDDFLRNLTLGLPAVIVATSLVAVIVILVTLRFTVRGKRKDKSEG